MTILEGIKVLEQEQGIRFADSYRIFLETLGKDEVFELGSLGIYFYSYDQLAERNETYEVKEYCPQYFMVAQDGDRGFFVSATNLGDNGLYICDLGALGSVPMDKIADDVAVYLKENKDAEM